MSTSRRAARRVVSIFSRSLHRFLYLHSFQKPDEIKEKTGFAEADVIKLMRKEMKPSSFRMWRKRVSGRVTKHRKLFKENQAEIKRGRVSIPELL